MGIFGNKGICCVCNKEVGKVEIKNEYICKKCLKNCGDFLSDDILLKDRFKNEIIKAIERKKLNKKIADEFITTRQIGNFIAIDESKKQWKVVKSFGQRKENFIIYNLEDVRVFELVEDGTVISRGGVGRAQYSEIIPNLSRTFINKIYIRVEFYDKAVSSVDINIVDAELNIHSNFYKNIYTNVKEIMNFLQSTQNKSGDGLGMELDLVEEIFKLDALFENGEIKESTYEKRKEELLGF